MFVRLVPTFFCTESLPDFGCPLSICKSTLREHALNSEFECYPLACLFSSHDLNMSGRSSRRLHEDYEDEQLAKDEGNTTSCSIL